MNIYGKPLNINFVVSIYLFYFHMYSASTQYENLKFLQIFSDSEICASSS